MRTFGDANNFNKSSLIIYTTGLPQTVSIAKDEICVRTFGDANNFNKRSSILCTTGVIIYDVNWNPSYDEQAQDRSYRIGQERDVDVIRLGKFS